MEKYNTEGPMSTLACPAVILVLFADIGRLYFLLYIRQGHT